MGRIAFFSDDDMGALCAHLVSIGLARLDAPLTLALPPRSAAEAARGVLPDGASIVALAEGANAFDVEWALNAASRSGSDLVAALPLSRIGDDLLRCQFDAVVTVGASHAAAARAMRAARYDTGRPDAAGLRAGTSAPAWFLAGSHQSVLWTKARLAPVGGPPLPFATRTLPTVLPRRLAAEGHALSDWDPDEVVLGTALLLAALSLAIAADPCAMRLDAQDLTALMAARVLPAERILSDRLLGLANAYGRLADPEDSVEGCQTRPMAGSRARRPPVPRPARAAPDAATGPGRRAYRA